jgi:pimeloyl-ACP methyl ester carboxylesterase
MQKGMKLKPSKHMILVQGAPVYYEVVGEGNPVILVHGLSGSTLWWVRNIQTLAQHHKVYLLDLPSFGTMNRAHPRFALSAAGSWLIAWMQAIGLQQADFIGHSMGGFICCGSPPTNPIGSRVSCLYHLPSSLNLTHL